MVEILVPISMFAMIFGIVAVVMFYRFRNRQELQTTVRAVVESGQPLTAEVLEELTAALRSKSNDLRRGVLALALGFAFVVLANVIGNEEAYRPLLGVSAFPFFIGIAHLVLAFTARDKAKQA